MNIRTQLVNQNFTKGRLDKIEYIVIHDTGNNSTLATAEAHYRYFNGAGRNASAHYFVDEKEVLQIIKDEDTAWHVGDGKGKYGVTNNNSIGIEICINDGEYTTEIDKTLRLTKYLMNKYNIGIDKVVRHYDSSRKICPRIMSANNWAMWSKFKSDLQIMLKPVENKPSTPSTIKIKYKNVVKDFDGTFVNDKNYVSVRELAEALGFIVEWEQDTKTVVIK